jgi:hypothetical protein
MIVTYTIYTQSMADAATLASKQAKASGYSSTFLTKVTKVGNGAWEVTLRLVA